MRGFIIILLVNIIYSILVLVLPGSEIFGVADSDMIRHYTEFITGDTESYAYLQKDGSRTIGYPFVLNLFMGLPHWPICIFIFNSFLGAWLFYVVKDMVGRDAWIFAGLGAFTAYIPMLFTDLLFAAVFVTSIWMIKKNLWLHFLLLGIASLIRPSLAWFFLIEPIILYFNGYGKKMTLLSLPIVFVLTSFNPIRNYMNIGRWTHSTIMEYNMTSDDYYASEGPRYFIKSVKANLLSGHYDFIGAMFGKYKRDSGPKEKSILLYYLNITCVLINFMIWIRFIIRVLQRKINFGYIIMSAYFIIPTLFGAAGARLRLPIEWILFI